MFMARKKKILLVPRSLNYWNLVIGKICNNFKGISIKTELKFIFSKIIVTFILAYFYFKFAEDIF